MDVMYIKGKTRNHEVRRFRIIVDSFGPFDKSTKVLNKLTYQSFTARSFRGGVGERKSDRLVDIVIPE